MSFDLLTEQWIPVLSLDGTTSEIGLLELYKNAHKYSEINLPNAMDEYALYRFLILFLEAAYRPSSSEDLLDILNEVSISTEVLSKYVELCKSEGVSFDIFDEKRPFLQSTPDPKYDTDKQIKSVASLDYSRSSGNNHVHFDHTMECDAVMTAKQAARALITLQVFCTAGLQGPSNVNGVPPLFWMIRGNNLLKTLILSMEIPTQSDDKSLELWRDTQTIVPDKKITKTSFWLGCLFPARRVRLIPESGVVKKVYLQKGLDFVGYDSWHDPHVAYYFSEKKGRGSIKPSLEKAPWRNIGTLSTDFLRQAPSVILQYQNELQFELKKNIINVSIYGVETNKASYLDTIKGSISLNTAITCDSEKCSVVAKAVQISEDFVKKLSKALSGMCSDEKDMRKNVIHSVEKTAYTLCGNEFERLLIPSLLSSDSTAGYKDILSEWTDITERIIWKQFEAFCAIVCDNADNMIKAETERKKLYYVLDKSKSK